MEETVRLYGTIFSYNHIRLKITILVVIALQITILHYIYFLNHHQNILTKIHYNYTSEMDVQESIQTSNKSYLVWSTSCQIPDIDPHAENVMALFKKTSYQPCMTQHLTTINQDENGDGILNINASTKNKLLAEGAKITCCYSIVNNHNDPKHFDIKIVTSECINFATPIKLNKTEEFIVTKCEVKNKTNAKNVYKNAHANIQISSSIKERLESSNANNTVKPWNVLIIGIDTLSRINLARAMPKTNAFLKRENWIDFQGYNKVDENTYPNLIAILTGQNQTVARKKCDGFGIHSPDNCDFMWKRYKNAGYVTAYAEDYVGIDTFGRPLHTGFTRPPTDHYLRPLFKSAEERVQNPHLDKLFCTGQTTSAEFLYNYALQFAKKYQDSPFFGFFWSNTFSHDDLSSPSSMDGKIMEFLEKLTLSNTLNTTIVFFISDHGLRFGKPRLLLSGYYEERLPAFFMWLPQKFKNMYPKKFKNILLNTNRLTSPYDVYMTLEDILLLSNKKKSLTPSHGCPKCESLFKPVPWNRSCADSSIAPHWCTCDPLITLPLNNLIGVRAVRYVIEVQIENTLNTVNNQVCRICAKLQLDKVIQLYSYNYLQSSKVTDDYLVVFSTKPGNMAFESTVRYYKNNDTFEVLGIVSRLTFYAGMGDCVKTDYMKNYCYCNTICRPDVNANSFILILIIFIICFVLASFMLVEKKKLKKVPQKLKEKLIK